MLGRRLAALLVLSTGLCVGASGRRLAHADPGATQCIASTSTAELNSSLGRQFADVVAFDSPRATLLPDGRVLWFLQDAYLTATPGVAAGSLRPPIGFAHNVAVVQEGDCFTTLHSPINFGQHCAVADASYVGNNLTAPCSHWFWAVGGSLAADGTIAVFFVEMSNSSGTGASDGAKPVGTWLATLNSATFDVISFKPAPDASHDVVFGYGVENDGDWSYLFGWTHDQFDEPAPGGPTAAQMYLARVPRGAFKQLPTYWNGSAFTTNRSASVPIVTAPSGTTYYPMQPRKIDGLWVNATKVDDWLGHEVEIDTAPAPQGPWTAVQRTNVPTRLWDGTTNTYSAHLLPRRAPNGNLVVALSNNAWRPDPLALDNPFVYRPTFFEVEAVSGMALPALINPITGPLGFVPAATPARVLDTRLTTTPLGAGETRAVDLGAAVAPNSAAVAINVTATNAKAAGYLTVWPCSHERPPTSNVNVSVAGSRAAHAVVPVDGPGVCVYSLGVTDVLVDVFGSYVPAAVGGSLGYEPAAPTRLFDSRSSGGAFAAGETRQISVPTAAQAVALNLTVTEPSAAGYVTVFPCSSTRPVVSNINMLPGQVVANLVQVATPGGRVCVYSLKPSQVVVDLVGTYTTSPAAAHYRAIDPTRLADTRVGLGSVKGRVATYAGAFGVVPASAPVALSSVPSQARGLMVSMIAVDPLGPGWGLISPCIDQANNPNPSSTLNFGSGDVVTNSSIVQRGPAGVCTYATSPGYHVVDLVGWFE